MSVWLSPIKGHTVNIYTLHEDVQIHINNTSFKKVPDFQNVFKIEHPHF